MKLYQGGSVVKTETAATGVQTDVVDQAFIACGSRIKDVYVPFPYTCQSCAVANIEVYSGVLPEAEVAAKATVLTGCPMV